MLRWKTTTTALAGATLAGLLVLASPTPAGAGVTQAISGTQLIVVASGTATVGFGCVTGNVAVNGTVATPALACGSLTHATVVGDAGAQRINGTDLDAAVFSAHPFLTVSLGDGSDIVSDTRQADSLTMGNGIDTVDVEADSVANTLIDLGTDPSGTQFDTLQVNGLATPDTMASSTAGANTTVTVTNSSGSHAYTTSTAEFIWLDGKGGDDHLSLTGIAAGGTVTNARADGQDGNDVVTGGPIPAVIAGETGTNTLTGGPSNDTIFSDSDTDTINPGGGLDFIWDQQGLRSGGRTVNPSTGGPSYKLAQSDGDAVSRIRPGTAASSAVVTNSLERPGLQQLPASIARIEELLYRSASDPADHGLVDAYALAGKTINVEGGSGAGNLADITVPSGTWSTSGTATSVLTITPTSGYGVITVRQFGAAIVHNPWPTPNQSFAHRVTRDLDFRFPTDSARTVLAGQLDAHTKTRAQAVSDLMDADEYRTLDVDRVFVKYLHRAGDPSGRAYWVSSLASGKPLIKFRAQLFGSNEYFNKAGGTNASYMQQAYADVLGRLPDAAGKAYWTDKLNAGADRGTIALQFLASTEARRNIVKDQYLRFVRRFPTTAEADTWVTTLAQAHGEEQLIATLAAGTEYFNLS